MASIAIVAIEATIVSTAMPRIVVDLGGLRLYSWVFSAFLLAQTMLTVVFGNLADLYGRKPVMLWGIAIFLAGSLLCGFSTSMPAMIAFRLIQGVGAGAIQPVSMIIIADLYPARERGKVQGYLASVWAVSAVLGPLVGGFLVRHFSWSWTFWINIPVGIVTAVGFMRFLHESSRHERRPLDLVGAATFSFSIAALLIGLTEMGSSAPGVLVAAAVVCCVSAVAFVLQEKRTANPMLSFAVWSHRAVAAGNIVTVLASMSLMGLTTFVPIYVQIILHRSPIVAGFALTTMLMGWPAGATLAARQFHRFELHRLMVMGAALMPLGALPFVLLTPQSSPMTAGLGSFIMGVGMGVFSVSALVLVQEVVERSQRGGATASNLFARNLGSTLGATLLGAVLNYGLQHTQPGVSVNSEQLRQLIEAPSQAVPVDELLFSVLQRSLHSTFWAMFAIALLAAAVAFSIPRVRIADAQPARSHDSE